MTVLLAVAASVALTAGLTAVIVSRAPWRKVTRRHATVTLQSGVQYDGIVLRRSGPLVTIGNGRMLVPGRDPVPVDGEIHIERVHVVAYQTGYEV